MTSYFFVNLFCVEITLLNTLNSIGKPIINGDSAFAYAYSTCTPLSKCIKEALEKIAHQKTLIEEEFVFTGIDQ